jgi:hypothetical protein
MKIREMNYQRNGVSGVGFYQIKFAHEGQKDLIATFTTEKEDTIINFSTCRVVDPNNFQNAYRGDYFGYEIQKYIAPMLTNDKTIWDLIEIINKTEKIRTK